MRNFLHAQKVQPLVELFVDWLAVGHVDEFLSFVPAPDRKVRTCGHVLAALRVWGQGWAGAGGYIRP